MEDANRLESIQVWKTYKTIRAGKDWSLSLGFTVSSGFVFARLTLSLLLVLLADRCMCDKAAVESSSGLKVIEMLELSAVVSSNIVK